MASSLVPRLLKRAPPLPLPLLTSFNLNLNLNDLSLSPLPPSHSIPQTRQPQTTPIFPSFPLFSHLDPIWHHTSFPIGEDRGDADPLVRCDSVKKKRKRKMNKHKLRKLRKQLRLRT
ncbi:U8 snoRNA-decapping enzyme [Rhynchospora pubera]|uniref:U8 snoRNA-decapping enzyme n=1 Tax=Rhynchospora pubera TaxID=906938 RepID=A0AAV8GTP3_9POAL|nr:U8 snoRNA-decapping enzyme [Rhynchospora pubera]